MRTVHAFVWNTCIRDWLSSVMNLLPIHSSNGLRVWLMEVPGVSMFLSNCLREANETQRISSGKGIKGYNSMKLIRLIFDSLARRGKAKPGFRLRITNVTRQSVLAHCVEVADEGAARRKGLLGRHELRTGEGLWIRPCEAVHTFGMEFSIDLVYLDRKLRVKKVRSGVRPWRLSVCFAAHSVLELASGTIRETQTRPGDRIEIFMWQCRDLFLAI
jgi:uncharacterized membrane protein (UPF0127 family)